jgi:hypothetical protein
MVRQARLAAPSGFSMGRSCFFFASFQKIGEVCKKL